VARIVRFQELPNEHRPRFSTEVECGYKVATVNGKKMLHLETYGSAEREIPGKVSQSIQLDEGAARELAKLIRLVFPD
jgi:hypothetical protein